MGQYGRFPFGFNNRDDDDDEDDHFNEQQKIEEYKRDFEDKIRRTMYHTIRQFPEEFFREKYIPNRIKTLNFLEEYFKKSEEYEKCDLLCKLKKRIEKQKDNKELLK